MARAPGRATMDFFAAQDAARRRTAVLVLWFALAWAGTVALVAAAFAVLRGSGLLGIPADGTMPVAWSLELVLAVAAFVTLVTLGGAGFHGARLASGGPHSVARLLGGVEIDRRTTEPGERRLVNVVEEMAIAAGLPVPALYVLPGEEGINAFAAGFTPDRAVIAVTRGALDALDRDELQGVVAHECSHLLNADARLNLQLVALVGGIGALAAIGRFLVRDLSFGRRRGRSRGAGGVGLAIVAAGLALWLAGSLGAFFGRLIRLAVARQREYLADAAAVQFTRNPDGLASALAKIARQGSALSTPLAAAFAPELAHLFFANGLASRWLATHPPLAERIRRVAPLRVDLHGRTARIEDAPRAVSGPPAGEPFAAGGAPAALVETVARPSAVDVPHAAEVLAALPPVLGAAARAPRGAAALACALVADRDPAVRTLQLAALEGTGVAAAEVAPLAAALEASPREGRMALLELALPALDGLGRDEAARLVRALAALDAADGRTTVFDWAVQRIVRRRLARALGEDVRAPRAHRLDDVHVEVLEVLSAVAWAGTRDPAAAAAAVAAAGAELGVAGWRPLPREKVRAARLDAALARLDGASWALKGRLLAACAACALADGRAGASEVDLVRAVAASLGCPMPPAVVAAQATPAVA